MNAQTSFPIVEDGRWIHFIYRGGARDVGIRGNMLAHHEEDPLSRVSGTDLFHRSYAIDPGVRWEYQFVVDFDNVRPDPLNPRTVRGVSQRGRPVSEVAASDWTRPGFLDDYQGNAPGRMESFELTSLVFGGTRRIQLYLPNDYGQDGRRYPSLFVTDGGAWLDQGCLRNTLNHLTGTKIENAIVVFVHDGHSGNWAEP